MLPIRLPRLTCCLAFCHLPSPCCQVMDALYQIRSKRREMDLLFDQLKEACALLAAEHRVKEAGRLDKQLDELRLRWDALKRAAPGVSAAGGHGECCHPAALGNCGQSDLAAMGASSAVAGVQTRVGLHRQVGMETPDRGGRMGSKAACTVENAPAYCSCGCLAAHSSAKKKCFSVATLLLPTRCAPPALLPRRPSWRASRPTSSALTQPSPSTSRPSTPAAASSPGPPGWRLPLPTLSGWVWAHAGWGKHGWVGWQLVSRQVRTWRRWPPGL